jgi:preprotein translocase subunit SecD
MRFTALKSFLILGITLLLVLLAVPSALSPETRTQLKAKIPNWLMPPTIVLGLDLQGGSHVLLAIDQADLIRTSLTHLRDDVRRVLREEKIAAQGGIAPLTGGRGLQVRVASKEEQARLLPKLQALATPISSVVLGNTGQSTLEVRAENEDTLQLLLTQPGINDRVRRAVDQAMEVLRRRVDALGTTEPNIQRQGLDRILVQVPGLQDPQRLKDILGRTAKLQFRLVANTQGGDVDMLPQRDNNNVPLPIERRVLVEGEDLIDAAPSFNQTSGEPVVTFRFSVRGAQRFAEATAQNVNRALAIVLDTEVISAPNINEPILGGSGQISGRFTVEQTANLAILLRSGALPAKLTIVEERTIGPGLGADSINAGQKAAFIGMALVAVFMLIAYGVFGVIAVLAVTFNVGMILGILSLLGATLTLPGIAGIVLTIGMAVDSNVLIYERIREEQMVGRNAIASLEAGFERALATIVDANLTTLIAAVVLFYLGTGPVRGFAITLSVGVLTTVFTAFTLTKLFTAWWYWGVRPKRLPL